MKLESTREEHDENANLQTETEFGIPIDYGFSKRAAEEQIQKTAESLRKRGFTVQIVDSPAEAREFVRSTLPPDKTVFTALSETVRLSGLDQDINGPESKYKSIRRELEKFDPKTQFRERVKLGAAPDVIVGSVHAITEAGQVLVGSGSGNQLGPYAASAEKAIWIVGSQKLVPDLSTGLRRLETYSYPLEDARMHKTRNISSFLAKILIINGDYPGRITVVLVREPIGF
jgi:uncharacterized protein YecE (DUF72 family)